MSLEALLNHKCDVYHIKKTDTSPGYNLPSSPLFSYPDAPDISGLSCHFNVKNGGLSGMAVKQNEPQAVLDGRIKLVLPFSADIRLNDKIVNCSNGYEYTAEVPVTIRNHHKYAMLRRTTEQEMLSYVSGI